MSTAAVSVTAEHIATGERESGSHCAVALALVDAFDASYVWVGGVSVQMEARERLIEFELPGEVEDFIHEFDDGVPVRPFTFTVDYPEAQS
jgi:hypothetical protein